MEMCEDKMLVATQKLDKVIMIAIARIRIVPKKFLLFSFSQTKSNLVVKVSSK